MRNRFAAFVTKGVGSAEALRHISDRLTAKAVVVLSAEAILGAPLREVLAMHVAREATLSAVFARKAKATAKDAKAKQPAPSDYVGLPAPKGAKAGTSNALEPQAQLIFAAAGHSAATGGGEGGESAAPAGLTELRLRRVACRAAGAMRLRADLFDARCHVLSRDALALIEAKPGIKGLREDLVPYLARHQSDAGFPASLLAAVHRKAAAAAGGKDGGVEGAAGGGTDGGEGGAPLSAPPTPGGSSADLPEAASAARGGVSGDAIGGFGACSDARSGRGGVGGKQAMGGVWAYLVTGGAGGGDDGEPDAGAGTGNEADSQYCAVVGAFEAYLEANRDLAGAAAALTRLEISSRGNCVHRSVQLGQRAAVGTACIVGEGCVLGDKTSIKRSVIGKNCQLGNSVKIVNAVLMDNVTVEDGVTIQGSVVCDGAHLLEKCVVKECQVGGGFIATAGAEYKGESLERRGSNRRSSSVAEKE